jgi:hypothetical protein
MLLPFQFRYLRNQMLVLLLAFSQFMADLLEFAFKLEGVRLLLVPANFQFVLRTRLRLF